MFTLQSAFSECFSAWDSPFREVGSPLTQGMSKNAMQEPRPGNGDPKKLFDALHHCGCTGYLSCKAKSPLLFPLFFSSRRSLSTYLPQLGLCWVISEASTSLRLIQGPRIWPTVTHGPILDSCFFFLVRKIHIMTQKRWRKKRKQKLILAAGWGAVASANAAVSQSAEEKLKATRQRKSKENALLLPISSTMASPVLPGDSQTQ
ncbi:uncharacterized protein [Symphalangus syndactylus]|uniref:uncharacterized protein n=1 Tax=Symphalangus syndactylus TaxID=9590 RepID=UPI00300752C4